MSVVKVNQKFVFCDLRTARGCCLLKIWDCWIRLVVRRLFFGKHVVVSLPLF